MSQPASQRPLLSAPLFAIALVGAQACSLMDLDSVQLLPCHDERAAACDDLNSELPDDACERWVCHESGFGCKRQPRDADHDGHANERYCSQAPGAATLDCDDHDAEVYRGNLDRWDGKDNDCNNLIDDAMPPPAAGELSVALAPNLRYLSHSTASDGKTYIALTHSAQSNDVFTTRGLVASDDALIEHDIVFDSPLSCIQPSGLSARCNFAQLALAAGDETLFAVGVNRANCAGGQLRVGTGDAKTFMLQLGAQAATSNVRFGVDLDANACTQSGVCPGAYEPVVATLPALADEPAQGLAVWTAPSQANAADCSTASSCTGCELTERRVIAALGLQLITAATGTESWLLGTNAGHSEAPSLETSSGEPPALVAFRDPAHSGYLLAYPADNALQLLFVPATLRTQHAATAILSKVQVHSLGLRRPRHVALTIDAARTSTRGLAVGWRVDQAGRPSLGLCAITLDAAAEPHCEKQTTLEVSDQVAVVGGPVLGYVREGFIADREALGIATGGWLLAWIEEDLTVAARLRHLMAMRIAEHTLERVGEPFELARGEMTELFSYTTQSSKPSCAVGLGYVQAQRLHLVHPLCSAPAE